MTDGWMGRYRGLVAALVRHGNVVARTMKGVTDIGDGIHLSYQQWQILEYIVENRESIFNMHNASYRLSIPQSTFSKAVQLLCSLGLVEKYQAVNNHKNIILRPTEHGMELFQRTSDGTVKESFGPFFDALSGVSDEDLDRIAHAIEVLDDCIMPEQKQNVEIIRIPSDDPSPSAGLSNSVSTCRRPD